MTLDEWERLVVSMFAVVVLLLTLHRVRESRD